MLIDSFLRMFTLECKSTEVDKAFHFLSNWIRNVTQYSSPISLQAATDTHKQILTGLWKITMVDARDVQGEWRVWLC